MKDKTLSDKGREKCLCEHSKNHHELYGYCLSCRCLKFRPLNLAKQEAPTKQGWEEKWVDISENLNLPVGGRHWLLRQGQVEKDQIEFIRSLLRSKDQEADRRVEEAYKKGFNLVLKHMVKHTGEEDGVLYLTQIDWETCRRILKKLLRQEIKKLSSK